MERLMAYRRKVCAAKCRACQVVCKAQRSCSRQTLSSVLLGPEKFEQIMPQTTNTGLGVASSASHDTIYQSSEGLDDSESKTESSSRSIYKDKIIHETSNDIDEAEKSGALRGPEARQKWYEWFPPTDTPEERKLLCKLDCLIMIFVFLAYWAKTLDSSSAQTAYVSGMKEALHMDGNELNYLNTVYQVGFIVMEIPMVMLVRFSCTVPIAFIGFICLPGTPDDCRSPFLTAREIELVRERLAADNRQPRQPMTLAKLRYIFLETWHFWMLVTIAIFFSQADGISSSSSALSLWLKSTGHSVSSINTITTISPAVTIVWSLVNGILNDAYDIKPQLIALTAILNIFAGICLAIWHIPIGLKYFSYFLAGTADGIAAVLYAWANEICAEDAEERALTISAMNTVGNAFGAWIPLFVWKTTDAPRYYIGYNWAIALDAAMLVSLVPLTVLWRREKKRRFAST
ncbi:MFS transporter (Seo1) [Ascosphaera atra]|nr:MFS transporter (Seo1) [Ascosphaera atra]